VCVCFKHVEGIVVQFEAQHPPPFPSESRFPLRKTVVVHLGQVDGVLHPIVTGEMHKTCFTMTEDCRIEQQSWGGGAQKVGGSNSAFPTCMWAEGEGVQPPRLAQLVEDVQVGVDVEAVVVVRRVVAQVPLRWGLHVLLGASLRLALVVHHVKPNHLHGVAF